MIILKAAYTAVNPTKNHQNLEPNHILYVFGTESCKFYWDFQLCYTNLLNDFIMIKTSCMFSVDLFIHKLVWNVSFYWHMFDEKR